jgi:hypothetical protein
MFVEWQMSNIIATDCMAKIHDQSAKAIIPFSSVMPQVNKHVSACQLQIHPPFLPPSSIPGSHFSLANGVIGKKKRVIFEVEVTALEAMTFRLKLMSLIEHFIRQKLNEEEANWKRS